MTAAKAVGFDVPTLNFKAMGIIFLSGVISNGVAYLAKTPVPPTNGDTTIITKP